MGGTQSADLLNEEDIRLVREAIDVADIYSDSELRRLYKRYCRLKGDKATLAQKDLMSLPQLAMNPLVDRVLSLFDPEGNDSITFVKFVEVLAVYHPNAPLDLKRNFAFSLYDVNGNNQITHDELRVVLRSMVGDNLTEDQLEQIVDNTIQENGRDGIITRELFYRNMIKDDETFIDSLSIKF